MTTIKADYLVIGSGAVSMAFVDTMLDESDATFAMIDRHHMPGGHWNDAYPFVRLHQPSVSYGVASTELGSDRIDDVGSNKGFFELASGAEVLAYFEKVMRERFLPSGRVHYFPMSDYQGDGRFQSLLSGETHEVSGFKKTVDGTYFKTSVPSTHKRKYSVAEGVACAIPNDLPRQAANHKRFTIVGAGKTAMDAGVWLLDHGADPDTITWIMPRDSWLIDRATTQRGPQFFNSVVGGIAAQMEAAAAATSVEDLFERLEAADTMIRIDRSVTPTMFHYATISTGEVEQLRRIKNVIRQGRIERIENDRLVMANGDEIPAPPDTLYIDCTATAVDFGNETRKVFEADKITLQSLFSPLVTMSASIIGYVEANFEDDMVKNRLCDPNILADNPTEWMTSFAGNLMRQNAWSQEPELNDWLMKNRLSPLGKSIDKSTFEDPDQAAVVKRIQDNAMPAVMNLQKLIAETA